MTRRFPDFTQIFDTHSRKACPNRYCRVHNFWSFDLEAHIPLPNAWKILTSTYGWLEVTVFCGPPAWKPQHPTAGIRMEMARQCPHTQVDLTCNYCLRHMFRPLEV